MSGMTVPIFQGIKRIWCGILTTADTSHTNPSTGGVTIMSAGTDGSLINDVRVTASDTTVASVVRVFAYDGSTHYLISEGLVTVVTASNVAIGFTGVPTLNLTNLNLASGWSLVCSVSVINASETYHVAAYGGDY